MIQAVRCTNCNKDGVLKIELKFTADVNSCGSCYHINVKEWRYHFCDSFCLNEWQEEKEIALRGFPCRDCRDTGFAFGFRENGYCLTCNGTMRLRD